LATSALLRSEFMSELRRAITITRPPKLGRH